jgi:hypothetical protein
MPTLRRPKHEKFAQLVATGMTAQVAFTQTGYPSPQNAPRLRNNEVVVKRVEELQARNERKAELAALSRDELVAILTKIVQTHKKTYYEKTLSLPVHPEAAELPMMDDAELDGLGATIKKSGLREPPTGRGSLVRVADGLPGNVCWLLGLSLDGTGRIYSARWS